jgi:hypothetical protein
MSRQPGKPFIFTLRATKSYTHPLYIFPSANSHEFDNHEATLKSTRPRGQGDPITKSCGSESPRILLHSTRHTKRRLLSMENRQLYRPQIDSIMATMRSSESRSALCFLSFLFVQTRIQNDTIQQCRIIHDVLQTHLLLQF